MKLGIDIGGTAVKFAVIDNNDIIYKNKLPSNKSSATELVREICAQANRILEIYDCENMGVGIAGSIANGLVHASNLPFEYFPVVDEIKKYINLEFAVENDANCAAYGEYLYNNSRKNIALITLGTGVGGGIIIDGNLCKGNGSMAEFGHIIIDANCETTCSCGQKGCLEQYASVTAFIKQATTAAEINPESFLAKLYKENGKLDGKLIFQAIDEKCPVAKKVFDKYLDWVAVGIINVDRVLNPDAIILSGGITNQGEKLLNPLKSKIKRNVVVEISALQEDAGVFGAAHLLKETSDS